MNCLDALYISTEDPFPTKRLQQMARERYSSKHRSISEMTDRIFIEHAAELVHYFFFHILSLVLSVTLDIFFTFGSWHIPYNINRRVCEALITSINGFVCPDHPL